MSGGELKMPHATQRSKGDKRVNCYSSVADSDQNFLLENRPFLSYLLPLCHNESSCETIH